MRSFSAATHIAAPPQHVWDVQLRLADWADWDPNIARAEGNLAEGGAITLYTRRPGEHKIRKFNLTSSNGSHRRDWSWSAACHSGSSPAPRAT